MAGVRNLYVTLHCTQLGSDQHWCSYAKKGRICIHEDSPEKPGGAGSFSSSTASEQREARGARRGGAGGQAIARQERSPWVGRRGQVFIKSQFGEEKHS